MALLMYSLTSKGPTCCLTGYKHSSVITECTESCKNCVFGHLGVAETEFMFLVTVNSAETWELQQENEGEWTEVTSSFKQIIDFLGKMKLYH